MGPTRISADCIDGVSSVSASVSSTCSPAGKIQELPVETLLQIFEYLAPRAERFAGEAREGIQSLVAAALTCQRFRAITQDVLLDSVNIRMRPTKEHFARIESLIRLPGTNKTARAQLRDLRINVLPQDEPDVVPDYIRDVVEDRFAARLVSRCEQGFARTSMVPKFSDFLTAPLLDFPRILHLPLLQVLLHFCTHLDRIHFTGSTLSWSTKKDALLNAVPASIPQLTFSSVHCHRTGVGLTHVYQISLNCIWGPVLGFKGGSWARVTLRGEINVRLHISMEWLILDSVTWITHYRAVTSLELHDDI